MYPRPRRRGAGALLANVIWLGVFFLVCYLGVAALIGLRLGHQIHQAKTIPLIGLGSQMIGRDATESFAIHRANIPAWVTDSPSFWIALRASE
jgi:hypothetical protein